MKEESMNDAISLGVLGAPANEVDVSELCAGEDAVVVRLDESDPLRLRKVLALGILPGVRLTLKRRSPCFVMQVGYSQFAVDTAGARSVFVRRLATPSAV